MHRQSHDREAPEQDLKATTAIHKSLGPRNEGDAGLRVAIADRHPQITHTRTCNTVADVYM